MEDNKNIDNGKEIKLNKNMRVWSKYKVYVIAVVVCVAVFAICAFAFKSCNSKYSDVDVTETETKTTETTQSTETTTTESAEQSTTEAQTTKANAEDSKYEKYTIPGVVSEEEFTENEAMLGSIILGDSIAEGISYYHILDDGQVVYDRNLNTSKAAEKVSDVLSVSPSNVFIILGLNDANSDIATDTIVGNIMTVVDMLKQGQADINVYVVSILPVTEEFEGSSSVRQSQINEINAGLESNAPGHQATYVDAASAFMDANTGHLITAVTSNGSNITSTYYPFLVNGLAGALK